MRYSLGYGYELCLGKGAEALQYDCTSVFCPLEDRNCTDEYIIDAYVVNNDVVIKCNGTHEERVPQDRWLATCIKMLKDVAVKSNRYAQIVFHGSCVLYQGYTFLFVGKSRSGKTTTLYRIMQECGGLFVSDDVTLCTPCDYRIVPQPKSTIQLRMPYARDGVVVKDAWHYGQVGLYTPGIHCASQVVMSEIGLDFIVDISYDSSINAIILEKKDSFEAINTLLPNILNIKTLRPIEIVSCLASVKQVYSCKYNGEVVELLEKII